MKQARTVGIRTLTYSLALAEDVVFLYDIINFQPEKPDLDQHYYLTDALEQEAMLQSCK